MDTTGLVTIIILALGIIIPVFINFRSSKKKKEKFKSDFLTLGKAHDLNITEYGKWNHYAIGLDRESKKIIYLNSFENGEKATILNLNLIKNTEVQEIARVVNKNKSSVKVLDQLKLKINFKVKDYAPIYLEFYHSELYSQLHNELDIIENWKKIIDSTANQKN